MCYWCREKREADSFTTGPAARTEKHIDVLQIQQVKQRSRCMCNRFSSNREVDWCTDTATQTVRRRWMSCFWYSNSGRASECCTTDASSRTEKQMDVQQVHQPDETIEVDVPLIQQRNQRIRSMCYYWYSSSNRELKVGICSINTAAWTENSWWMFQWYNSSNGVAGGCATGTVWLMSTVQ